MSRSSSDKLHYDIRPAKQTERQLLVDIVRVCSNQGLHISKYKYIGMGAVRFYDFLLFNRSLGIKDMISIESFTHIYNRAQYSKPYKFINVLNEETKDFISNYNSNSNTIFWLDYDGGVKKDILEDVNSLSTKIKKNDFLFVTCPAAVPKRYRGSNRKNRLSKLKIEFEGYAGTITLDDVENSNFYKAVHKILKASFKKSFSQRSDDGKFIYLIEVTYKDTSPMITIGGGFFEDNFGNQIIKECKEEFPFLYNKNNEIYEINPLNITEKERILFDHAATANDLRCSEYSELKKLGFDKEDIKSYEDLIRYIPKYVERIF